MSRKVIAVIGATGAQGGGLVRAIQRDATSEFTVRAITRNANSEYFCAARDLALSRELHPGLQDLAAWLKVNKDRIPLDA